jgi:glyoxylase-like metal-dependent hydrolase (beta-lactamase superfamily II)
MLPGGVEAHDAFYPGECVLWIPSHRALVFAESIYGIDGSPRVPPPDWLPEGATDEDFKASLAPLAALGPEWILPTHGEPIANAASGLRSILGA